MAPVVLWVLAGSLTIAVGGENGGDGVLQYHAPTNTGGANANEPYLKSAQEQYKQGHYRLAWEAALFLQRSHGEGADGLHAAAQGLIDQMEARAKAIFDEGEKHWWYREYDEAEPQFRLLFQEFPHSRYFVAARGRLISLRFLPTLASKKLLTAAQAKETAGDFSEATKRYSEVIAQYPDTVAAVKARKALDALQNDPDKRKRADAEAEERLARELETKWRLAQNYLANPPQDQADWALYDRGVAYLHEIIALSPRSALADRARLLIKAEQDRIAAEEKARAELREKERRGREAAAEKTRQNQ